MAHALYEAIDTGDQAKILAAQKNLTAAAEQVWARVEQAQVSTKDKAIVRLLADGAIKELPQSSRDPANYPRIQHELHLLKNSLVLLE